MLDASPNRHPLLSDYARPLRPGVIIPAALWLGEVGTGERDRAQATTPPNEGMKLTSVEHIGRSQLIPGVLRTSVRGAERRRYLQGPVHGVVNTCHKTMQDSATPTKAAFLSREALSSRGAGTKLSNAPIQQM